LALVIFLLTYAVLGTGRVPGLAVNRPLAALLGAVAMILAGVVPLSDALAAIDLRTLGLLCGLMLLASTLADTGLFDVVTHALVRHATSGYALLAAVIAVSGVFSALFLNDAVCILFTPLVLILARRIGRNPLPFLLGVATASNVGGACTITGNPQNALIGTASGISFAEFAARLLPASALGLVADFAILALVYRATLEAPSTPPAAAADSAPARTREPWRLALSLGCAAALLAAFLLRADLAVAALAAGAVAAGFAGHKDAGLRGVDFPLLVLFAGLFVVTAGVRRAGIADHVTAQLAPALAAPPLARLSQLSAIALVLSNLVSNVPAVMLLAPALTSAHSTQAWLALAMASTFAGNLTLVGSIANLIVAELAKNECPISFVEYLKVGVPLTLLTTAIGIAILYVQAVP